MGLGIGGVETHVVGLSKGLKEKGYDVLVASNGGVFEKNIKRLGIRTENVPMHTKHPLYVIKSLLKLNKIIRSYKPDVVHAHARIPALYVSVLSRFYKFKMVTTVHGTYKVNPLLKRITKWGPNVLSVSPDITTYLKENYDMNDRKIIETVNGIDLDIFVDKDRKNNDAIVHVSRLGASTCKTASYLIDYAIKYNRRLIIFGDGSELEKLKIKASDHSNIELRGSISKVQEGLLEASLFVGISRAALEAMSMNIAVILAGDYGVVGYLDEETALECREHNFTARNQASLSYDLLEEHLEKYFASKSEIDTSWSREFIKKFYSQSRMVEDSIACYKVDKKIFVIGYYGSHNLGDEFLLYETLKVLGKRFDKSDITALSYSAKDTMRIHGVKSVSRNSVFKIMKTIRQSDVVIGGGGSMLQNVTSNKSLFYYLWLLNYATLKKKSVALIGNGIGPIRGKLQSKLSKNILKKLDYIHLRDDKSYEWLKDEVKIKMDPGVDLALKAEIECKDKWGKKLYINLREWKNSNLLVNLFLEFKTYLEKEGYEVEYIAMQKGNDDIIMSTLGKVSTFESPEKLLKVLKTGDIVIGMRLHFLILASNYGIPFIGLSYDPKVAYYCELFNQPYFDDFTSIKIDDLIKIFKVQTRNQNQIQSDMKAKHELLRAKNKGIEEYIASL